MSASQAIGPNTQLRSRRGRNGLTPALTPIRPTLDYSTTGSYLGGESTVDNDTTTDGETFVSQSFGRPRRASTMSSTASKPSVNDLAIDNQEVRTHRIIVPRQGRESPHPQPGNGSRGAGPVVSSPQYSFLLPDKIRLGSITLDARQAGEFTLLNVAVALAVWRLFSINEKTGAFGMYYSHIFPSRLTDMSVLLAIVACSFVYEYGSSIVLYLFPPKVEASMPHHPSERPPRRPKLTVAPQHGYIFMTDDRNYR